MNAQSALERLARVEGRVEEHSRMVEDIAGRFANLEARLDRAEANINARFDRMEARVNSRFEHMDGRKMTQYFPWTIAVIVTYGLGIAYQIVQTSRLVR